MNPRQFVIGCLVALGFFDLSGDPFALVLTGAIAAVIGYRVFHVKRDRR